MNTNVSLFNGTQTSKLYIYNTLVCSNVEHMFCIHSLKLFPAVVWAGTQRSREYFSFSVPLWSDYLCPVVCCRFCLLMLILSCLTV